MFNQIKEWILGNPLDQFLKPYQRHARPKCLICWNRGLGDIPLGLYALTTRIKKNLSGVTITFLTREDLATAFQMLEGVKVLIDPTMKRGESIRLEAALAQHELTKEDFDLIIEKVDTKRWLRWQLGKITPELKWNPEWDLLAEKFGLEKKEHYLAVHVSSETSQHYGYEKNWPQEAFQKLFNCIAEKGQQILLFGMGQNTVFQGSNIIDLRGKTSVFEMISLIKHHCSHLLAPDSGVLSIVYYINAEFPLRVVSLWADPRQGVLKQKVRSPNSKLVHHPLIGRKEQVENISVEQVLKSLYC